MITKKRSSMTKVQIAIIIILAITLCSLAIGFTYVFVKNNFPANSIMSTSANFQSTNTKIINTALPIETSSDNRIWIIYEVIYTPSSLQRYVNSDVNITWENNTGGTNQGEYQVGDGISTAPFRYGYTANIGEYFSIIAQLNGEYWGELKCNIYIADTEGDNCLVTENKRCGTINDWKSSFCNGAYCICQTSGIVGSNTP